MMIPYGSLFPEDPPLGVVEVTSQNSYESTVYELVDFYCSVGGCDCCKVSFRFLDDQGNSAVTISYGWKPLTYYIKWGIEKPIARLLTQGFIEPMEYQSSHASFLFNTFQNVFMREASFISNVCERYQALKEAADFDYDKNSEFYKTLEVIKEANNAASPPTPTPTASLPLETSKIKDFAAYKRRKS